MYMIIEIGLKKETLIEKRYFPVYFSWLFLFFFLTVNDFNNNKNNCGDRTDNTSLSFSPNMSCIVLHILLLHYICMYTDLCQCYNVTTWKKNLNSNNKQSFMTKIQKILNSINQEIYLHYLFFTSHIFISSMPKMKLFRS